MKKISWYLDTGFPDCIHEGVIKVADNVTEEIIEALVRDEVSRRITWGWKELE